MRHTLSIIAMLGLAACTSPAERLSGERLTTGLAAATARGAGTRVALTEFAGRGWRRMAVFGPYTAPADIARCLGPAAAEETHDIQSRDDANLLVFEFPDGKVEGVAVPRSAGDFAPEALWRTYSPDQAVFLVRRPPDGASGNLVPADSSANSCS